MKQHKNYDTVMEYAKSIVEEKKVACVETIQMCERFIRDLENPEYDFNPKDAEFVIQIIEKTFVHQKGEDMQGYPLRGKPFLLEPWQKFTVYNLLGFFHKGTILRKYKEAFIMLTRKQGKTPLAALLNLYKASVVPVQFENGLVLNGALLKQFVKKLPNLSVVEARFLNGGLLLNYKTKFVEGDFALYDLAVYYEGFNMQKGEELLEELGIQLKQVRKLYTR